MAATDGSLDHHLYHWRISSDKKLLVFQDGGFLRHSEAQQAPRRLIQEPGCRHR